MNDNNWADLEPFKHSGSRRGEALITISAKQAIIFNSVFIRDSGLEGYDYVILYYSKAKNALVFRFTKEEEKGTLKISKGINASISARSFFNYYKFDKDFKGKFKPKKEEIKNLGTVWVIYMNEPTDS